MDPADWSSFRRLAHEALEAAIDFLENVRERPVWQPMPDSVKVALAEPLPVQPQGVEGAYRDFRDRIFPYSVGNVHPRFWGWVHGAGLPAGIIAESLGAAMDANCGGRDHAGVYVERTVIEWCRTIFGFPRTATGVLLTGTSMANLVGLTVARNTKALSDLRIDGMQAHPGKLVAYASTETHESVIRACEIIGLGRDGLRLIPVDRQYRIVVAALRRAVTEDRAAGKHPFCVVGTAGTVNTGAIDDLVGLAEVCRQEGLWFHIDGAFGALARLSDEVRSRVDGIELADSLAFDFHKWAHVQYDAGCLLVRDGETQRKTFSMRAAYLARAHRGLAGGGEWPCDLGPELSRGFRALKVWFALKTHGTLELGRAIAMNCRQAEYLASLVDRTSGFELMSRPTLSVVCFRVCPPDMAEPARDVLNENLVADIQESGVAAPSTTRIRGSLAIRVNITNHRTTLPDLDLLVHCLAEAAARRIGLQ